MPPNVLLIVLDSVRARNTSLHGYHRETTPFISDLGSDGVVFRQARAPSVASLPSHISIFTGYHTAEHGFGNGDHYEYRLRDGETIWEELNDAHGYRTGVFSTNPYLTSLPVGLSSAFHTSISNVAPPFRDAVDPREYHEDGSTAYIDWLRECLRSGMPVRSVINGLSLQLDSSSTAVPGRVFPERFRPDDLVTLLLDWVDDRTDRPWAACLNLMEAHTPYTPAAEFDEWSTAEDWDFQSRVDHFREDFTNGLHDMQGLQNLENLYDGAIREADRKVERLVTGLERRGMLDETFVVLTSDHGEGFGESSRIRPNEHAVGHSVGIHESQLHVPLVLHPPKNAGEREDKIGELASLTRLPAAVRSVLTGDGSPTDALVSKRAIATQIAEDGLLHAVYEQRSGSIYKHISGADRYRTVELTETGTAEVPDADTERIVSAVLDGMRSIGVKEEFSQRVDSDVKDRLADLGYR